jgi:hypothetical protein
MLPLAMSALDGRKVRVGGIAWEVRSHRQRIDQHVWVQVALVGQPFHSVFLKMSPAAQARDAIEALEWWLSNPGHEDGDVIEVG